MVGNAGGAPALAVGAFVGGFVFGGPDNVVGYIGATIGAILALLVYRLATRGSRRTA